MPLPKSGLSLAEQEILLKKARSESTAQRISATTSNDERGDVVQGYWLPLRWYSSSDKKRGRQADRVALGAAGCAMLPPKSRAPTL